MTPIEVRSPVLEPVREAVRAQIADRTKRVVSQNTPLESVPTYRGEIAALEWLLVQLSPQQDITET